MKTKLIALAVLAGSSLFAETRFSVGVGVGGYAPGYYQPQPAYDVRPPCPGPGYEWIESYSSPYRGRAAGYWSYRGHARDFDRGYDRGNDRGYRNNYRDSRHDHDGDRDRGRRDDHWRGR
jgi:hypothetical protein